MTEQFGNQDKGEESFMDHCREEAISFSLKIAELVAVDAADVEQEQ